jgi:hypothetical protein
LPQPDGPTITINSPSAIARSSSETARVPSSKIFETLSKSIVASVEPPDIQPSLLPANGVGQREGAEPQLVAIEAADVKAEGRSGTTDLVGSPPQIPVGASRVARRRRDFSAVVFDEGDLAADALPGRLESLERDRSRPLSGGVRSALAAERRDHAAQPGREPPPVLGQADVVDATAHSPLDGGILGALSGR